MKKLSYLLVSLLMIPVMSSCNKPIDDKINNNEELMAAVHFDNIEYAQVIEREPKDEEDQSQSYSYYSPTMYHSTLFEDEETIKEDLYVEYDNGSYTQYLKRKDKDWERKPVTSEYFITPPDLFEVTFLSILFGDDEPMFGVPLTLNDFDYSNGEYICKHTETPEGIKCKIILSFLDKKVKKLISYSDNGKEGGELVLINSFEFEYKQITPELPDIPLN